MGINIHSSKPPIFVTNSRDTTDANIINHHLVLALKPRFQTLLLTSQTRTKEILSRPLIIVVILGLKNTATCHFGGVSDNYVQFL